MLFLLLFSNKLSLSLNFSSSYVACAANEYVTAVASCMVNVHMYVALSFTILLL